MTDNIIHGISLMLSDNVLDMIASQTTTTDEFHYWQMTIHHFKYKWAKNITKKVTCAKLYKNINKKLVIPTTEELKIFSVYVNTGLNTLLDKEITTYSQYLNLCR